MKETQCIHAPQITEDLKTTVNELFATKFGSKNMGPKLIFFSNKSTKVIECLCSKSAIFDNH